jgi:hypothetical protein
MHLLANFLKNVVVLRAKKNFAREITLYKIEERK